MYKIVFWVPLALLFSCGGGSSNDTDQNTPSSADGEDTKEIVTYEMDDQRLSAVEFNNELTLMHSSILDQVNQLFSSDSSNIKTVHGNILFDLALKRQDLNGLLPPEGGEEFQSAMDDLFAFYEREFSGDFMTVIDIMVLGRDEMTDANRALLDSYDSKFAQEEAILFRKLNEKQKEFAEKSNFTIEGA